MMTTPTSTQRGSGTGVRIKQVAETVAIIRAGNRRHLPPAELGIAGFKLRLQDIDERDILRLNSDQLAKVASFALPGHPASIPSGRFSFLSVRC